MARRCIVCGRRLKTGRKYCYKHRGGEAPPRTVGEFTSRSMRDYNRRYGKDINKMTNSVYAMPIMLIFLGLFIISFESAFGTVILIFGILLLVLIIYRKFKKNR